MSLCCAEESFKPKSDIAQYLKLDIKRKNPFEAFKPLGDRFGIPLPSLKNDEVVVNDFQVKKQTLEGGDFNFKRDNVLNTYILGTGFNQASTLLSDYIKETLRNNGKDDVVNIEVHLNGVATREESGVGGNVNLLYSVHKDRINTLELLGGFNHNPTTQMWSGSYGAKHKIQHTSLRKLYFEQSFVQKDDLMDERTWKYGVGYSLFGNFKTYIERENNKESEDSTKAGVQYKITF
ncbi:hypothetical protein [Helicobacter turcicus]|uniref:hypothetical protein n=1 Tax=Helicobacter turcicus TaxID=2867412 RepID=UPI001C8716F9|nr:hypothetical protein [Helicobacter turcicus]MBX7544790.1 hypothetical protein [Helicobacter turcicus]